MSVLAQKSRKRLLYEVIFTSLCGMMEDWASVEQAPGCENGLEVIVESSPSFPGCEKNGLGIGSKVGAATGIRVDHAFGFMASGNGRWWRAYCPN